LNTAFLIGRLGIVGGYIDGKQVRRPKTRGLPQEKTQHLLSVALAFAEF
jgi:hypothetical protein